MTWAAVRADSAQASRHPDPSINSSAGQPGGRRHTVGEARARNRSSPPRTRKTLWHPPPSQAGAVKKSSTARFPASRQEQPDLAPARWYRSGSAGSQDGQMTNRRPLGTGCDQADLTRAQDTELPDMPRARLAAERLDVQVATAPASARPAGRRALGTGPVPAGP